MRAGGGSKAAQSQTGAGSKAAPSQTDAGRLCQFNKALVPLIKH